MPTELEDAFEAIAEIMARSAKECSAGMASAEAERHGLREQGDGTPSQSHVWERSVSGETLRFQWRWYDQSKAFSIQPDMNILSLELRRADTVLRKVEERFED
jgi:hypothetical protein